MDIAGKTIALGVCGGIAAYRSCDFIRELYRRGAKRIIPLLTTDASAFVTPLTLQALCREEAYQDSLAVDSQGTPLHISIAQQADALVILPASANTLAKMAAGMADDLVTTTFITFTGKPVIIAPAMNTRMWQNPLVQRNLETLTSLDNVTIVPPRTGELACGEYGEGHLADTETILRYLYRKIHPQAGRLAGIKALVSGGGTREAIDPVRYITNRSSGKMGLALADELDAMGASVTLVSSQSPESISGAQRWDRPYDIIQATTAAAMYEVLQKHFAQSRLLLMAAAVSDFRVADPSSEKLKKEHLGSDGDYLLHLVPNLDILATLAKDKRDDQVVVGFAAESQQLHQYAQDKLKRKNLDAIIANDISRPDIGFQASQNEVTIIFQDGEEVFIPRQPKAVIARQILTLLSDRHFPNNEDWEIESILSAGLSL